MSTHTQAAFAAKHVENSMLAAGISHSKHKPMVDDALASDAVTNLFTLMDAGTPAATADGNDQLKAALATVAGLCSLVHDHVLAAGGTPDPFLTKTMAGLTDILAH